MSTLNCIAISGKSHCLDWLYGLNDNLSNLIFVEPEDKVRISSLLEAVDVDIVLVHLPSQDRDHGLGGEALSRDLAVIEDIASLKPGLVIIALVEILDQSLVLPIIRAGVRDIIRIGIPAFEAQAIINRYRKKQEPLSDEPQPEHKLGRVYAVLDAHGGDGSALFSYHVALKMQRHGATLLLDVGMPAGDIMLMMGLTARFNLRDVILNRTRLDATLIETGFARHPSGLSVISMPGEIGGDVDEIMPADLHLVLHALKRYFAHIVIHLAGVTDSSRLKPILLLANASVVLVEQTVPSCKRNHDLVTLLRQQKVGLPGAVIVVDRYATGLGPAADSIADSFDLPLAGCLPSAGRLRLTCMNTGESLFDAAPHSAYTKAVRKLVWRLLGGQARDQRLRRWLAGFENALLSLGRGGKA